MTEGETFWVREEIVHSQLASAVYDNICVRILRNGDGSINLDRYSNLDPLKSVKSIVDQTTKYYDDDCIMSQGLFESFNYISVVVYPDGVSVNGKQIIPFGDTIHSSAMIPSNDQSLEDSILFSLGDGTTIVVRFCLIDQDAYEIVVLDTFDLNFSGIVSNDLGTKVMGLNFFKTVSVFDIQYSRLGSPVLEFQQNIVSPANIIGGCILKVSNTDDIFVNVTHSFDKITRIDCYSNIEKIKDLNIVYKEHIMKNTFEMPLFLLPLRNTKSVLFLQNSGFTIKGSCFLLTGSGDDQDNFQYPPGFKLDNYFLPKELLNILSDNDTTTSSLYGHDQILVSSSPTNSIYLIDIFFNHTKGGFRISMKKLFSLTIPFSVFSIIPFGDHQFKLTFSSSYGATESRIVEFQPKLEIQNSDSSIFSLKYIEKIFTITNPLPIFDFCLIENTNFRASNEFPKQEFWCSGGVGVNNKLMNIKKGFISSKSKLTTDLPTMDKLEIIEFAGNSYILISRNNGSCFVSFNELSDDKMDLDESQTGKIDSLSVITGTYKNTPTLGIYLTGVGHYFRVLQKQIIFGHFGNFKEITNLELEEEIIVTTFYENRVYGYTKSGLICWEITQDFQFEKVTIQMSSILDPKFVTMLKIEILNGNLYLFVGYLRSLHVFKTGEGALTLESTINFKRLQMPSQMRSIDGNTFLITSIDGFYSFIKFDQSNSQWDQIEIKISDVEPLEIAGIDKSTIFLFSDQLWRIDLTKSIYCKPVVVDESKYRSLYSTCLIMSTRGYHMFLVNRNDGFSTIKVPTYEDTMVKSFKVQAPIIKMFYINFVKLFVLIPIINRQVKDYWAQPKLIFFDSKQRKELKWRNNDIFEKGEYIQCVSDLLLETENGNVTCRILIGCRVEGNENVTGSIKICNIKINNGDIQLESLYSWNESGPITCISSIEKNNIIYSVGTTMYQRNYNAKMKKLDLQERKLVLPSLIKKFEISDKKLLIITANDSYEVCDLETYQGIKHGDGNQYLGDGYVNSISEEMYELLLGDAQGCSVNITNESGDIVRYKVGTFPRISKSLNFGSWLTYDEKVEICKHSSFITVGMGGQIDSFTSVSKCVFERIVEACKPVSVRGPIGKVSYNWIPKDGRVIDVTQLKEMGNAAVLGTDLDSVLHRFML